MGNHCECKCNKNEEDKKAVSFEEEKDQQPKEYKIDTQLAVQRLLDKNIFSSNTNIETSKIKKNIDSDCGELSDLTIENSMGEEIKIMNDWLFSPVTSTNSNTNSHYNNNYNCQNSKLNVDKCGDKDKDDFLNEVSSQVIGPISKTYLETISENNNEYTCGSKENSHNINSKQKSHLTHNTHNSSGKSKVPLIQFSSKKNKFLNKQQKYSIETLIPMDKISKENEILFKGVLLKYSKNADYKFAYLITSRFLILTKDELRIYRSKELYLRLKSPLMIIKLRNVLRVEKTEVLELNKKSKEYFSFFIEFFSFAKEFIVSKGDSGRPSFETSISRINNDSNRQLFNQSQSIESFLKEKDDYQQQSEKKRKPRKMSPIPLQGTNSSKNIFNVF